MIIPVYNAEKYLRQCLDSVVNQTLRDIDTYNRYCEEHPLFMNSVTEQTSIKIKEVYHECLDKNNFL